MASFIIIFLMLIYAGGSIENDLSSLNQEILKDIYDIYNLIPLAVRNAKNITVYPDKIKYYLFLNNNTKNYTIINSSNASAISRTNPVLFLIHGWTQNRTTYWYQLMMETFFGLNTRYNVIQVDYSPYSEIDYVSASSTTEEVGNIIGKFVATLNRNYSIPIENILIIGHSLGGQVSSFLGRKVQNILGQKLPRIIALDPAGPLFEQRPLNKKLNKNDATVVDVIHTNGGVFGHLGSCGTIDFYPNGGSIQPNCIHLTQLSESVFCNHQRSWSLFAAAVKNKNHFKARECNNWATYLADSNSCPNNFVYLGDFKINRSGKFYLRTTGSAPYYDD